MQIGVYGTGYLATVIAACLADFGTPVMVFNAERGHVRLCRYQVTLIFMRGKERRTAAAVPSCFTRRDLRGADRSNDLAILRAPGLTLRSEPRAGPYRPEIG